MLKRNASKWKINSIACVVYGELLLDEGGTFGWRMIMIPSSCRFCQPRRARFCNYKGNSSKYSSRQGIKHPVMLVETDTSRHWPTYAIVRHLMRFPFVATPLSFVLLLHSVHLSTISYVIVLLKNFFNPFSLLLEACSGGGGYCGRCSFDPLQWWEESNQEGYNTSHVFLSSFSQFVEFFSWYFLWKSISNRWRRHSRSNLCKRTDNRRPLHLNRHRKSGHDGKGPSGELGTYVFRVYLIPWCWPGATQYNG